MIHVFLGASCQKKKPALHKSLSKQREVHRHWPKKKNVPPARARGQREVHRHRQTPAPCTCGRPSPPRSPWCSCCLYSPRKGESSRRCQGLDHLGTTDEGPRQQGWPRLLRPCLQKKYQKVNCLGHRRSRMHHASSRNTAEVGRLGLVCCVCVAKWVTCRSVMVYVCMFLDSIVCP